MADSKLTVCAFLFLAALARVTEPTPIPPTRSSLYSFLIDETNSLYETVANLATAFRENRLPNEESCTANIPNLRLSSTMTLTHRMNTNESDLLSDYHAFFADYNSVIPSVLEDERISSHRTDYTSDIQNISSSIARAKQKLVNLMNHLDISLGSEESAPVFTSESRAYERYQRDCFVLQEMENLLLKAKNDFPRLQTPQS